MPQLRFLLLSVFIFSSYSTLSAAAASSQLPADFFLFWKDIKAGKHQNDDNRKIIELAPPHFIDYGLAAYHTAVEDNFEASVGNWNIIRANPSKFNEFIGLMAEIKGGYWKIHVAADPARANLIARLVVPILFQLGIRFKITGSELLKQQEQTEPFQKGKFITIYPMNYLEAKGLIIGLNDLFLQAKNDDEFKALKNPPEKLLGDAEAGTSGFVFVRYGVHHVEPVGRFLGLENEQVFIVRENGDRLKATVQDVRSFPCPEFILRQKGGMGGDTVFFAGIPVTWTVPGTDFTIELNDQEHPYRSWLGLIKKFDTAEFRQDHVKNDDLFQIVLEQMKASFNEFKTLYRAVAHKEYVAQETL